VRDIEHLVTAHKIAAERRKQGKPIWAEELRLGDIFHNDDMSFPEKRDAIVARIRATRWYKGEDSEEWGGLHDVTDNLSDARDVEEFDYIWNDIYDLADYARVWIETTS
jgi:hypothetical protein